MRVVASMLLLAGVVTLLGGAAAVTGVVGESGGCADECHGALFFGMGALGVFLLALALLGLGAVILTQAISRDQDEISRELRRVSSP
jgi:hypothetical protein